LLSTLVVALVVAAAITWVVASPIDSAMTAAEESSVEEPTTEVPADQIIASEGQYSDQNIGEKPDCVESLQGLIDAATPGSIVEVPGNCVYREALTINKPLTLKAGQGAEIRGSDVWQQWSYDGNYWMSDKTYPELELGDAYNARTHCQTDRCDDPEQVFVDGEPLVQVASEPQSGEFALDNQRKVLLADDPRGKVVEVSVRQYWIRGEAPDVTIDGFVMKYAATPNRSAAIFNGYESNWTVENSELAYAHSTNLSLKGGEPSSTHRILNNDIHHAGKMGLGGSGHLIVGNNHIHDNDTESWGHWEAGGMKFVQARSLHFFANEVDHNNDHGVWCDAQCHDGLIENNRIHNNVGQGIFWEVSYNAVIRHNVIYENGWPDHEWASAGIMVATSDGVEVYRNLLAWNADGIVLQCQNRPECKHLRGNSTDAPEIGLKNTYVHHNMIIAKDWTRARDNWAHAWLEPGNRAADMVFDPRWNNRSEYNRYWYSKPEGKAIRWKVNETYFTRLAHLNRTQISSNDRYMKGEEKNRVLSEAGVPASSEPLSRAH
jgi:parallel beta-helix repeat protein